MALLPCRFCLAESNEVPATADDCYRHCSKAEDGKHKLSTSYVARADAGPDQLIIDVLCANCGESGSLLIEDADVNWE